MTYLLTGNLERTLSLWLADASGGASRRGAGRRRVDGEEGADRSVVRRRRVVRGEVDDALALRRGVLDLCRRNEKILSQERTYESPMRRCNRCASTRESLIVRELYLCSMRPFPSCVGLSFLLLKEPRVLSRQIRSHDLLLGDEDRRPSCLDSGDSRRAKVVTNEL